VFFGIVETQQKLIFDWRNQVGMSVRLKGLEKSSRSKADLFELLVAELLIRQFSLRETYKKEITALEEKILKFPDGKRRIREQVERAEILSPVLIKFLKRKLNSKGKITNIEWVGRLHKTKGTVSDINISFEHGQLKLSLKSVGSGTGTLKNIGAETVKRFLGIDINKNQKEMWTNIRKELKSLGGAYLKLTDLPQTKIKNSKYKFKKLVGIGRKYGEPVQVLVTKLSVKKFNLLTDAKKIGLLKHLLGRDEKGDIVTFIVQDKAIVIYPPDKFKALLIGSPKITAKKLKRISYGIFINGKIFLRIQSSFTNGVGLSAFCQRVFFA